jgi:3-oxoacyl-[acyl-carrier-protein] synthase I
MSRPVAMHVIGAGAVTSVGNSLPATAAAVRAGLNAFHETQFIDGMGEPIIGAQIRLGEQGAGMRIGGARKLGTALARVVEEAVRSASLPLPLPASVPLLFLDDSLRPAPLVDAAHLCHDACKPLFDHPERLHMQGFNAGEVACVDALLACREYLANGAPFVLIAAADSWLRSPDLHEAMQQGRLLQSDSPSGFVPGEAAAAIMIGPATVPAALAIEGLGLVEEAASLPSDAPCYGRGLAHAMRHALLEAGWQPHEIDFSASDAAGEVYFAEELATAWTRLLRHPRPNHYRRLLPAASTGHVGSAFGPLMLALGWQLARIGRLPGPRILMQLSSSHTLRGAIAAQPGAR